MLVDNVSQSAQPVPFERNLQNISRKMEIEVASDGKTQVVVKDDKGAAIRYIPPVSMEDQMKLEYESKTNHTVDSYI